MAANRSHSWGYGAGLVSHRGLRPTGTVRLLPRPPASVARHRTGWPTGSRSWATVPSGYGTTPTPPPPAVIDWYGATAPWSPTTSPPWPPSPKSSTSGPRAAVGRPAPSRTEGAAGGRPRLRGGGML